MKLAKRLASALLALAVVCSCLNLSALEAHAAAPKTSTLVIDSKNGVISPTKVRAGIQNLYNYTSIYLANDGDYVASVTSNSSQLVAKITYKAIYNEDYNYRIDVNGKEGQYRSRYEISYFAKAKGTYTLTATIKNAKKKTTCKKKITVYVEENTDPIKSFKYAGKEYAYAYDKLSKKASGKLQITMNKGFQLQKIERGVYVDGKYEDYSPEPVFKSVKNKSNISLATSTKYTAGIYSYQSSYSGDSYESGTSYDYLYPVTVIRVTYKDTKLGIVRTTEYNLFYQNK